MKSRILIVDDEAEIRDLLHRHFRYLGYDVDTASGGQDALAMLAQTRTDIVVSDINMPGMDGVALLEAVRQDYPMIRVVMMTGYVSQENILACMRKGAETCIFKPLEDLAILERAVFNAEKVSKHWWRILSELRSAKPDVEVVSQA